MASPRVLVREDGQGGKARFIPPAPDFGWQLLGWLGWVFLIVGGIDIALTWYPFNLGNPDWEFGTISSTLDSLPVTTMGLAILLASSVARGWKLGIRIFSILLLVAALLVVAAIVIYLLNLPLAFKSVTEPILRTGLKKAVTKTISQGVFYPTAFVIMGMQGWRHANRSRAVQ